MHLVKPIDFSTLEKVIAYQASRQLSGVLKQVAVYRAGRNALHGAVVTAGGIYGG